ncbi:MAG TPA: YidB family protein [Xanthobacteraceae bacterium]|nr:YidB family protein [Xanthobacteraceae bacterium]
MGLLDDVLSGLGGKSSSGTGQSSGGMSPITMALLGLLAYHAFKGKGGLGGLFGGGDAQDPNATSPQTAPNTQAGGGGLGGLLGGAGGLGGLLSGAAAGGGLGGLLGGLMGGGANAGGSVVSNGLQDIMRRLEENGQGDVAKSWVGDGANKQIAPDDLGNALGGDVINHLSQQTGMDRDELLQKLSQELPQFVDKLTPKGRVPTPSEAA